MARSAMIVSRPRADENCEICYGLSLCLTLLGQQLLPAGLSSAAHFAHLSID